MFSVNPVNLVVSKELWEVGGGEMMRRCKGGGRMDVRGWGGGGEIVGGMR